MDWRFFEEKDLFWILKASKDMYKESYLEEKGVEFNEDAAIVKQDFEFWLKNNTL